MREPQEIAQRILEAIPNHRRWLQGDYAAYNGTRLCLRGAMKRFGATVAEQEAFAGRFCAAVLAEDPHRFGWLKEFGTSDLKVICNINDDDDMTYERLRQLLEKVAAG